MGVNQSSSTDVGESEEDRYSHHYKELFKDLMPSNSCQLSYSFKDGFISLLGGPSRELGERLYCFSFGAECKEVTYDSFVLAMSKLKSAIQSDNETFFLFTLFSESHDMEGAVRELIYAAALCALQFGSTSHEADLPKDHPLLSAVTASIVKCCCSHDGTYEVTRLFRRWLSSHSPHLLTGLRQWLLNILVPVTEKQLRYHLPLVECDDNKQRHFDHHFLVWALSSTLPIVFLGGSPQAQLKEGKEAFPVGGTWTCLYSSRNHGFSMNRFKHHCFDYKKPSILTIECYREGQSCSYAIAMDSEWRDGNYFYGEENFCLIQLTPTFSLLKRGAKLVSLNEKQRGFPCGLRVMASEKYDYCLLEIKASLEEARINEGCWMQIHLMEVWGCGGVEAAVTQQRVKEWESKEILRRRKINRGNLREMWEESPDKALLDMGDITTSRPTEQ